MSRMAREDRYETAAHFAEIDRLLKRFDELREEDLARQARADRELDAALAELRAARRRLAALAGDRKTL